MRILECEQSVHDAFEIRVKKRLPTGQRKDVASETGGLTGKVKDRFVRKLVSTFRSGRKKAMVATEIASIGDVQPKFG